MLIELDLEGVRLEMPTNMPILMLRESGGVDDYCQFISVVPKHHRFILR